MDTNETPSRKRRHTLAAATGRYWYVGGTGTFGTRTPVVVGYMYNTYKTISVVESARSTPVTRVCRRFVDSRDKTEKLALHSFHVPFRTLTYVLGAGCCVLRFWSSTGNRAAAAAQ